MTAFLARSRTLLTRPLDEDRWESLEDGGVVVDGALIAEVGAFEALARRFPHLPVKGDGDDVITPGLVDAHHHVGLTPFQLGIPDLPLEVWAIERIAGRDVDPYLDTLYSAFELVASGVTTVHHILDSCEGSLAEMKARADAIIRAYRDIGMRAAISYGIADQNHFVHQVNEAFLASLPAHLARDCRRMIERTQVQLDGGLELFETLWSEHHGGDRIAVQLAPANLHWCSDRALSAIAEASARHDAPVHMHLLETPFQRDYAPRQRGATAFRYLQRFGLHNPRLTIGHGVWLTGEEIDAVAECGASICVNCSSNLRLRSGRAPLRSLAARKLNLAMGIDEAGINDDRDMLQEMRVVRAMSGEPGAGGAALSPGRVLTMATLGGARTTAFAGRIGTIEAGRRADMVFFHWPRIAGPYLDAAQPIEAAIVHRARTDAVRRVICDGRTIFENGAFAGVDRDAALDELAARMNRHPSQEEIRRREVVRRLIPYIRRSYGLAAPAGRDACR
ncbi:MAG: amidohydrolase family protein [Parvibaculaceae bacterium]